MDAKYIVAFVCYNTKGTNSTVEIWFSNWSSKCKPLTHDEYFLREYFQNGAKKLLPSSQKSTLII